MKRIIQTLRHIGLGILNVCFLMVITFYVLAVVGVNLFSEKFPQYFGSLSLALFTNFRLMVFDDFGIIAEPIAQVYPYAWIYFLIIVLLMSFTFINLFIAVVVTALQRSIDEEKDPVEETVKKESKELKENEKTIEGLAAEIQELKTMIKKLISN